MYKYNHQWFLEFILNKIILILNEIQTLRSQYRMRKQNALFVIRVTHSS